jgi:hypothetical protein
MSDRRGTSEADLRRMPAAYLERLVPAAPEDPTSTPGPPIITVKDVA